MPRGLQGYSALSVFDVTDYGARGDGVTDESTAITAAIAAIPSRGGILFCPYGVYLLASTVVINKQVQVIGQGFSLDVSGAATVFLKKSTVTGPALKITSANCTLRDFQVDAQTGNSGDGIAVESTCCTINRVAVTRQGQDGIRIGNSGPTGNMNNWRLDQVSLVSNGRDGLHLEHPTARNAGLGAASAVLAQTNARYGFYLGDGALNNAFIGCTAEQNTSDGVRVAGAGSGAANNFWFGSDVDEVNGGKAVTVEAGAADNHFISCTLQDATHIVDSGAGTVFSIRAEFSFYDVRVRRILRRGTALAATDFGLSAAWGATASFVGVRGSDQAFVVDVTASGAGIAANPVITLTFKDGAWAAYPVAVGVLQAGDAANLNTANVTTTFPSLSTLAITLRGTPVGGTTYTFYVVVLGT